ncbi:ATP-binding cassette domain-containing protein [Streptomyces diastatochromogenes]|nr:ATP-binding cassette domain-containing protein [Streptomyces diastatochromogenes]
MTPVVRVRAVTKSFGGAAALKGVDLDLYPGEIHALMGMNGAGKSTLVQILSGVHQADGGTIEVDGQAQHGLTVRRARRLGIASVPQRRRLAMGLTVAENVLLGDLPTRGRTVHWKTVREEARRALSSLGIDIDVERTAGSLTVAEQTIVEVAREVRRGGRILILDEPTACLSARDANRVRALVRTLRDEGVAVVYISHYIDEVMAVADRLTVLRDGTVVRTAPAADLDPAALVRAMTGRDVVSRRAERPTPRTRSACPCAACATAGPSATSPSRSARARSSPYWGRPGTPSPACSTCFRPPPARIRRTPRRRNPVPFGRIPPRSPADCAASPATAEPSA